MTTYEISDRMKAQLANNFVYHSPIPGQPERYTALREKAKEFAEMIATLSPPSREQSEAITCVENAMMWANAGIARNEGAPVEPPAYPVNETR